MVFSTWHDLKNGLKRGLLDYTTILVLYQIHHLSNIVAIVGRAITVWEAIQKRSHEPI